jgi:RNA recognition motif-containing protein
MGPGQMAVRPPRANPAGGPAIAAAPARPAPPGQNKNDLAAMLAQATPEQQKQMLGERLYMLIIPTQPELAGKITGMLLEGLDTAELVGLIDSPLALDEKIKLALEALKKHTVAPGQAAGPSPRVNPAGGAAPARAPASLSASLYVGDLNKDVREEHLFEIFSVVGPIDSIRVLRDHISRVSLGYAYVTFSSAQDAKRALETLNYYMVKGRPLRIMWRDPSMRKSGVGNISIKNIDTSVTSRDLDDTFFQFGEVLYCKVASSDDGKSKGFGFVQYQTREEAERAVKSTNGEKLTRTQLHPLIVAHCTPEEMMQNGEASVYVKNFREDVTDEQLAAAFACCGKITSALVAREGGKSKKHGYVVIT